jgi:hypothetical protein
VVARLSLHTDEIRTNCATAGAPSASLKNPTPLKI